MHVNKQPKSIHVSEYHTTDHTTEMGRVPSTGHATTICQYCAYWRMLNVDAKQEMHAMMQLLSIQL